MNYEKLEEGQPLQTPEGPATFIRYKADNFKLQNVLVKLTGRSSTKWFTEAKLNKANKEK